MILKLTLLIAIAGSNIFASTDVYENSLAPVNQVLDEEIGKDNTCLDEYIEREQKIKKYLIWTPPLTIVGAPASFMVTGYATAGILNLAGSASGWGALGTTIGAAGFVGVAALATGIGIEAAKALEFKNNRYMIKLIVAAQAGTNDSKEVKKFLKKYRRNFPQDSDLSDADIMAAIARVDSNGELCNGTVSSNVGHKRAKKLLAKRRHLLKYIHQEDGNTK